MAGKANEVWFCYLLKLAAKVRVWGEIFWWVLHVENMKLSPNRKKEACVLNQKEKLRKKFGTR